jgi:hypothetical protein
VHHTGTSGSSDVLEEQHASTGSDDATNGGDRRIDVIERAERANADDGVEGTVRLGRERIDRSPRRSVGEVRHARVEASSRERADHSSMRGGVADACRDHVAS